MPLALDSNTYDGDDEGDSEPGPPPGPLPSGDPVESEALSNSSDVSSPDNAAPKSINE